MNQSDNSAHVAFVTGGAMGIGASICQQLAAKGYTVLVADINLEAAAKTADALVASGHQAAPVQVDLGNPESIRQAFAAVEKDYGRCDVLVNNAGIAKMAPFLDFPLENWLQTMSINVTGVLVAGQCAARLMLKNKWGRIVNISSISGIRAGAGRTAYGASKSAVIGLTRQMSIELAVHGITVNSVAPGPVDTPMTEVAHSEETRQSYHRLVPMRRYGSTNEIAAAVTFLTSDEASYITGHVIPVDGGFVAAGVLDI
ncbi:MULTISPECIES: 3-oxoacyl-ACP reductase family protein [unclassified Herbaspirillum]|uniref:SDR family NAD(P)-dependent oxidoreductase n=1 Tax=unclassified Herbaspirillum TaxID=2624150 RepID=UPI000E2FCDAC|nr:MULTISPECIES: 3-oxoacyl-ACP reductase family protein [unclassified Herbaspirillum]RFB70853.1 3-oxoacyl-ACP reductase FabG [Herbaspirillum sp. 3R-3a1]TFI08623.1 3-oxoacyl-ACP reductase FabG [Herbaspirillum sp. 3R11]TFI15038.1 3-oxoacyl-ACP reductase FabG [Herbaspirillum sp. 3R-11]TFI29773.1 3-oxoacyl-ACP reductase FabG [Herbaspirillum sp. 3C11]